MTSAEQTAVERTAEITLRLDRDLTALGPDAMLGSMFVVGWLVAQLGEAAGATGAEPGYTGALEPVLEFARRQWAEGVARGAAKRLGLH